MRSAVHRVTAFAIFAAVALATLASMHAYIWVRLVRDPGVPEPWRRIAALALGAAALLIPAAMVLGRFAGRSPVRALPVAAFVWLGLAFLLVCTLLAIDAVRATGAIWGQLSAWLRALPEPPADPARRRFFARSIAGGAALVPGGAGGFAYRSATGPAEIEEVELRLERLPRPLSGYTIAQISDLHVGLTIRDHEVARVVDQVNALRPDLVVITGDLVDGTPRELGPIVERLAGLRARQGTVFVTGNHDFYSGVGPWLAALPRLGIRTLQNERIALGDEGPGGATFDLAGVHDWSGAQFGPRHAMDLPRALAGRDPDRSLVLLAHQPRGFDVALRSGVELQLSGHTHGGQIFPFSLIVAAVQPYVKGLYRVRQGDRAGQIYVSRGTGYWGPPLRLGAAPEIGRLVLTPA